MRKAVAIFFLFTFTFSLSEAGQLLKMPLLVEHLRVHQRISDNHTLTLFLIEHYLKQHKDDGDRNQDNTLPFKTATLNGFCVIAVPISMIDIKLSTASIPTMHYLFNTHFIPANHLSRVFHPPQGV